MSNVISVESYVSLAEDSSNAVLALRAPSVFIANSVDDIAALNAVYPTLDLITPFFNAYQASISTSAYPSSWITACRALNNHVINRGGYADIDAFLATGPGYVPQQWIDLSLAAGFTISSTYLNTLFVGGIIPDDTLIN